MDKVKETLSLETLSTVCADVSDRTESAVAKVDELLTSRLMRLANHAAVLCTLKALADKVGMAVSLDNLQIETAADKFVGVVGDLEIAGWCYNIWAICAVLQLASVAKSVLADKDELSQADITAMAASNFFVARMVGSDSPLQDTVLAALVAGYAMRSSASKLSLHMASTQLASAFLTTAATLGVVAAVAGLLPSIPVVGEYIPNVGKLLAVVTMHGITNRPDNGTVKEIVNGIILAGMSFDALIGGIDLALDLDTILANATLVFLLYVSFQAVDNARRAVLDL